MNIYKTARQLGLGLLIATCAAPALAARPLVDAAWVEARRADSHVVLLDVRKAEDYAAGHIPGALSTPYGAFGWRETIDEVTGMMPPLATINERIGSLGIDPSKHVVIVPYGATSRDVAAAARVYWTFKVLGHDKVSLLDGGMNAWTQQPQFKLQTTEVAAVDAGAYPGQVNEQLVIDTAGLVARLESGDVLPIDARIDEQWHGESKHPKALAYGAIETAKRLPEADLIDEETGKFISADAIRAAATAHGWDLGEAKPLVPYCNTGNLSSTVWFALSEIIGIDNVAMYDGSMVAWTRDASLPVINQPSRGEQLLDRILGR